MSSFQHMHWVNKQPYKAHIQKHRIQGSERGNDLFKVTWLTSVALGSLPGLSRGKCANSVLILRMYVGAMVWRWWLNRPGAQRPAGPGEKQNKGNSPGRGRAQVWGQDGRDTKGMITERLIPNLPKDKGMWISMS